MARKLRIHLTKQQRADYIVRALEKKLKREFK